ncbi:glycosyltransferase [Kiloniella majae]|uniref:glycosyltransferase n=1 Tax=Kiloniella majae TaxID=1938558 RepID=UPI000A278EB1|nr:glycosyltransferase [Kiloniella majae]
MHPATKISLIITTYNWPQALGFVLRSLEYQTDKNFEVIIADDGSGPDTKQLIKNFSDTSEITVKHFWHEDDGFRVAAARNGAAALAEGDYFVFIDGDCCLMPSFIASHRKLAEKKWFVAGRRVYLKKRFTAKIFKKAWRFFNWPSCILFIMGLTGQCNRPFQFLSIPQSNKARKKQAKKWEKVQTCNLGVWKEDFYGVDGFDESYEGHGLEDSDFTVRLIRSGVHRIDADYCSPVLHLFHSRSIPGREGKELKNPEYFQKLLESDRFTAVQGISCRLSRESF